MAKLFIFLLYSMCVGFFAYPGGLAGKPHFLCSVSDSVFADLRFFAALYLSGTGNHDCALPD